MKKVLRLSSLLLVLVACFTLASCGKISGSYAKKINKAAEKGDHITYEQVEKALGDDAVFVGAEILGSANGAVVGVKGCDSLEDIQAKLEEGKTVKGIVIVIVNNKATAAEYKEITKDDLK